MELWSSELNKSFYYTCTSAYCLSAFKNAYLDGCDLEDDSREVGRSVRPVAN